MQDVSRFDTLVTGGLVVTPGGMTKQAIGIRGEQIVAVAADLDPSRADRTVDATGKYIFPGIIDAHNHPVYGDNVEAFSQQMAAGGVTTIIPFIGSLKAWGLSGGIVGAVDSFIEEGNKSSYLDFGIHVTFLNDDDVRGALPDMVKRGVRSGKMFMVFKKRGMLVEDPQMLEAMKAMADHGFLAMVHAENEAIIQYLEADFQARGLIEPQYYPPSRPNIAEAEACFRALALAETVHCPLFLVHLSAHESLDVVRYFRARGKTPIFAETCHYYLLFTEDELVRQGGLVKISPPFRKAEDQDAIINAINDGTIDVISTDGSGQTRARKAVGDENIFSVVSGICGSQFMVPIVWSQLVNTGRVSPTKLAEIWCERPARIFGLYPKKGVIQVGSDADLVVLAPGKSVRLGLDIQRGNSDYSPFEGYQAVGYPVLSMQRGHVVLEDGELRAKPGAGAFLPAGDPVISDKSTG